MPECHSDDDRSVLGGGIIYASKTVYNWRRAERIAKGEIRGVQPGETPEQAVVRLTREIRELQEANYILRKAPGFMAGR